MVVLSDLSQFNLEVLFFFIFYWKMKDLQEYSETLTGASMLSPEGASLMMADYSLHDEMLLNLHWTLQSVNVPEARLSKPTWTIRLHNDSNVDTKGRLIRLLPDFSDFFPTTVVSILYRCESQESDRGKCFYFESIKTTPRNVFVDLERIGALSIIEEWDLAWDVMAPLQNGLLNETTQQDVLTLGYIHDDTIESPWYHVLHQSRESKFDFSRTEYDLPAVLHDSHHLPNSLLRRLLIAQMFTMAYVTYWTSMDGINQREILQLKDITFWYNSEILPDEPRGDFLSEDPTLALKLQLCWQTILGQVEAHPVTHEGRGWRLTHGEMLHCLAISVYIILSGKNITFEPETRSISLAKQRVRNSIEFMRTSEAGVPLPSLLIDEVYQALRWEQPANLQTELLKCIKGSGSHWNKRAKH